MCNVSSCGRSKEEGGGVVSILGLGLGAGKGNLHFRVDSSFFRYEVLVGERTLHGERAGIKTGCRRLPVLRPAF